MCISESTLQFLLNKKKYPRLFNEEVKRPDLMISIV